MWQHLSGSCHYDGSLLPLSSEAPPTPQWVAGGGRPAAAAPPILPLLLLHPLWAHTTTTSTTGNGPNSTFFLNVSIPLGFLDVDVWFQNSPKGKSRFWQSGSAQVAVLHQKHDRGPVSAEFTWCFWRSCWSVHPNVISQSVSGPGLCTIRAGAEEQTGSIPCTIQPPSGCLSWLPGGSMLEEPWVL